MNIKFLIAIITLVFSTSSALAEGKSKHKAKVANQTTVKSSSEVKISIDQFGMLSYWTILGLYENDFDRTNELTLIKSKSFVVGCSLNLTMLMFPNNEKWLDVPTYMKRGMELINSSKDGGGIENKNCSPPTKALLIKVISDPRPFTNLDDIRVDSASLQGHEVMVEGKGIYIMNQFMLKSEIKDLNPVLVHIENLDVNSKKMILQKCGDMMAPCDVVVNGTVGSGPSPEVIATMISSTDSQ